MTNGRDNLTARVNALGDIIADVMVLATSRDPDLRPILMARLEAIAEDCRERQDEAEAKIVESFREDFIQNT